MSDAPIGRMGRGRPQRAGQGRFLIEDVFPGTRDAHPVLPRAVVPYARYAVPVVTGTLAAILVLQTFRYERDFITLALEWKSIALVAAFAVFLASLIALATRRPLASIALACGTLVLLTMVSVAKYDFLHSSLYALDFYYYMRPTELVFLHDHYPRLFHAGLACLVLGIVLACLLFAFDETRLSRRSGLIALGVAALALAGAYQWRGQRDKIYHFVGWHHVSAAPASAPEAFGVLFQGGLLKAADKGGRIDSTPIARFQHAGAEGPAPTVISILHESSFPTGMFPVQCGGRKPAALYTSGNGRRYELRVETYGGATWLTEYGLMLGISTYYFGDARSFIGYTMENKVRDSLAQQMRHNGYETVAFYPSPGSFVNSRPFYRALGFDRFLDMDDLKAETEHERDRFYYAKAIEQIRAHKATGSKAPLFPDLWTMTPHGPYDYTIHPGVEPAPESICGKDASWAEYIRRMLMAEDDLAWFSEQLKAEFPNEPFMLVGFGDHQPFLTQEFLEPGSSDSRTPARNSDGYRTFFRITGVNFTPDWGAVPSSIDTPFLGNVMLQAARLPRFGFYNDRDKLMELCRGRYEDCPHQDEILSLHERMIRSRTVVSR